MSELCTAGYSEYGAAAPPFRDCRQEAIDSGNCGDTSCEGCWDHDYWANVGYEVCPDWVVDAMNAEGAAGGQCAAWTLGYENACREWGYPKEGEWNVDEDCCAGKKQMACADGFRLENTGNVCNKDCTAYEYHCIACDPASACMGDLDEDGEDYGCDEDDEDDDDDDGGTELVMSGGLVAIGLTFTGISIAAIANAFQEQCTLGPTIVYEAGTTHPYYISPNLCTIGTKTYASKTTVRDASPRKVCRKFCEAASEKGKLALKHVQGLTCYCKRR